MINATIPSDLDSGVRAAFEEANPAGRTTSTSTSIWVRTSRSDRQKGVNRVAQRLLREAVRTWEEARKRDRIGQRPDPGAGLIFGVERCLILLTDGSAAKREGTR